MIALTHMVVASPTGIDMARLDELSAEGWTVAHCRWGRTATPLGFGVVGALLTRPVPAEGTLVEDDGGLPPDRDDVDTNPLM